MFNTSLKCIFCLSPTHIADFQVKKKLPMQYTENLLSCKKEHFSDKILIFSPLVMDTRYNYM